MKRTICIIIMILLVMICVIPITKSDSGIDKIYVDDNYNSSTSGWGYDRFSTIQEGVNMVSIGGEVYVSKGIYNEYITINKSLSLKGANRGNTIIDCQESGDNNGILISTTWNGTNDVTVSGFTVRGKYGNNVGIYANPYCNNLVIENCIVHSFSEGITLREGCSNITIRNCICFNNNRRGGICLLETNYSNIKIINCDCYSNTYGITLGLEEDSAVFNCVLYHNNLYSNSVNAYDSGNNIWDNGKIYGGNYYGDYKGTDNNKDGMGDSSYSIQGGDNKGLYPFMEKNGWIIPTNPSPSPSPNTPPTYYLQNVTNIYQNVTYVNYTTVYNVTNITNVIPKTNNSIPGFEILLLANSIFIVVTIFHIIRRKKKC